MELGDAVVVNADDNTVSTEYDDIGDLPDEIVSSPAISCFLWAILHVLNEVIALIAVWVW